MIRWPRCGPAPTPPRRGSRRTRCRHGPAGHARLLNEAQSIRRDDNTTTVVCDACHEGHIEEVVFIESPPGSPIRAYMHCPAAGRVPVPLERLKQWVVDFLGLAVNCTGNVGERMT